jgi:hypothetical protein
MPASLEFSAILCQWHDGELIKAACPAPLTID